MAVNLSIKKVPDGLAERLRQRAIRNRRSLQKELLGILTLAAEGRPVPVQPGRPPRSMSIDDVAERVRTLFPQGTGSSVEYIRRMRDERSS